ncbi:response regulator [Natrinema gelatinilyticum]|uniref:response regulator n=1 Tax=Natrinema gelatinilyticum TaxID=2961571 RepID=UPI0020C31491|nr:response regulator [Natrinema gelatinilyticum]
MIDGLEAPIDILLVEDDSEDARHIVQAFSDIDLEIAVRVVTDGADALQLLSNCVNEPSALPDLVLLDLNLPRLSGLELLREIGDEPVLARLPILVVTKSATVEDVRESYELAANAYLTKPMDPAEYAELAEAIADFWLRRVALPTSTP